MDKKLLAIVALLLLVAGLATISFLSPARLPYFESERQLAMPTLSQEERVTRQEAVDLPTVDQEKVQQALSTGGEIPFDYSVVRVSENEATLRGARGDAVLPNSDHARVFLGKGENQQAASFSDLKVGQKVTVELIGSAPDRQVNVYIVE